MRDAFILEGDGLSGLGRLVDAQDDFQRETAGVGGGQQLFAAGHGSQVLDVNDLGDLRSESNLHNLT